LLLCRVEIADTEITEGKRLILKFSLKAKPECPQQSQCRVQVTLANKRPDEIALSKCYLEWDTKVRFWASCSGACAMARCSQL
jgi:hypothetical protein